MSMVLPELKIRSFIYNDKNENVSIGIVDCIKKYLEMPIAALGGDLGTVNIETLTNVAMVYTHEDNAGVDDEAIRIYVVKGNRVFNDIKEWIDEIVEFNKSEDENEDRLIEVSVKTGSEDKVIIRASVGENPLYKNVLRFEFF